MGYKTDASNHRIVAAPEWALGRAAFARTDDGSTLMNIDGSPGGSSTVLWNGTGVGDAGGDWTPSGTGSETAGSMHSGTNGWDTGVAGKDAATVFDSGSMQDIAGSYQTLKFWMNPQAFPGGSFLSLQWLNSVGGAVGARLDVNSYVPNFDLDVWQEVSIPIADFLLPGNAQKLQVVYRKVAGQHFHFDDFELWPAGGGGGPYTFEVVAPDAATKLHLTMAVVLISAPDTGWASDAFGNVVGGLSSGLVFRHFRKSTSEALWSFNTKNNMQLFGQYHPQESFAFSDSKLLVGFMIKPGAASVLITDDDVLQFIVQDDLSSISEMRAFCHHGVEEVA